MQVAVPLYCPLSRAMVIIGGLLIRGALIQIYRHLQNIPTTLGKDPEVEVTACVVEGVQGGDKI